MFMIEWRKFCAKLREAACWPVGCFTQHVDAKVFEKTNYGVNVCCVRTSKVSFGGTQAAEFIPNFFSETTNLFIIEKTRMSWNCVFFT